MTFPGFPQSDSKVTFSGAKSHFFEALLSDFEILPGFGGVGGQQGSQSQANSKKKPQQFSGEQAKHLFTENFKFSQLSRDEQSA